MSPNATDILDRLPRIPTLPKIAVRVLEMSRCTSVDLRMMAAVIEKDQALTVKIIRTVNSSFYGLSRPCANIHQAMVYLGLDTVRMLVLGFSLVESIDGGGENDVTFNYVDYWRRAIHSAAAARKLARGAGACDPDEAFLAALVQDVGMVALSRAFGDKYLQVIDMTGGDHSRLAAMEQKCFELDHAEVGAAIADHWQLPPLLGQAIRFHHRSEECTGLWRKLVRIVDLAGHAAAIAASSSEARPGSAAVEQFQILAEQWFGLSAEQTCAIISSMAGEAMEVADLLNVNAGKPLDLEAILAEAEELRVRHMIGMQQELDRLGTHTGAARIAPTPAQPTTRAA